MAVAEEERRTCWLLIRNGIKGLALHSKSYQYRAGLIGTQVLRSFASNVRQIISTNMRTFAIFFIFAFFAYVSASALPEVYDGPTYELAPIPEDPDAPETPIRARRVTCDLFSFESQWLTPRHSACAVKCIAQRRRGGSCQNGVCVCR